MADPGPGSEYVLGHSERELERLKSQASMLDPVTRRFFAEAGIGAGMRVLDVGSGAGDVAFVAAGLVGESGEVVGVDRSEDAVRVARDRAAASSLANVSFLVGDPDSIGAQPLFDAALGRFVLQFQDDPAAMLAAVSRRVRPGGIVVFHELDWDGVRSMPPVPSYDRCCRLIRRTLEASGTETRMGARLFSSFVDAGLATPTMRLEAMVGGGENAVRPLRRMAELTASMAETIEQHGVASIA
jgi:SAM-dependent methyltransferase